MISPTFSSLSCKIQVIHFSRQGETKASIGIAPKDGFGEIPASAYTVGLLDGEVWSNPFIIEQKAPTGTLFINSTGNVGIGTTNPTESLEVIGNINASGSVTEGSSRALKKDITDISLAEATETLKALNPVKFKYKVDNSEEEHLGFIAEDVPSFVAYQDRKRLRSMDITAVMTKVMQEQQREIQEQKEMLREQQKIISELLQEMREIKNKI
ncbi:MAG: tail fiber domain-containing protein [Planctomycetes bacterium]|nr:tail fiber domain-containing protein [Planctomycetota bacterium]